MDRVQGTLLGWAIVAGRVLRYLTGAVTKSEDLSCLAHVPVPGQDAGPSDAVVQLLRPC